MKKLILLLTMAMTCFMSCKNNQMELQKLLSEIEQNVAPLRAKVALQEWNGSISGNEKDFKASAEAQQELIKYLSNKEIFRELKKFKESNLFNKDSLTIEERQLKRELDIAYNSFLSNQADTTLLNSIIEKSTKLEQIYGSYRAQLNGKPIDDNQVENILKTSTDNKVLEEVWKSHKAIGREVEKDLIELVKLRNQLAKSLGFDNYHSMTLELSGQDPAEVSKLFDKLDEMTKGSFAELKGYMDSIFCKRYHVAKEQLMPWHYQGRYFQESPDIYPVNLDKYYSGKNLELLTQNFYNSIGMDISAILKNSSLYAMPGKNQHAFCTDIDGKGDVRVLCNIVSNEQWMGTMLHEFGHAIYAQGHDAAGLPYLLRDAAHTFTTEAVAMMFGRLSRNAEWMCQTLGLNETDKKSIEEACYNSIRLAQIVFSRWVQVVYRFEKEMYANPDQNLNQLWWTLVEKYQMLKAPEGRNEPDYASKIHIALYPCYYHNYQMGELLASQMHYYIVNNITKSNDVMNECYIGNKEIGNWLKEKIFAPGMTYEWNDFIERATGEKLNPKYYAMQFGLDSRP